MRKASKSTILRKTNSIYLYFFCFFYFSIFFLHLFFLNNHSLVMMDILFFPGRMNVLTKPFYPYIHTVNAPYRMTFTG
jgi:hypothetical protein